MGSREKLLLRMHQNPKNWRIEQLETLAKHYGITVRKTGGSHVVFDHPNLAGMLCVPARRPIKPIYIRQFLALINHILERNHDNTGLPIHSPTIN